MNFVSRLSITYNAFNLPETISSGNTLQAKYTYLSDGTKVSALDASGAGLVYRGPFTYRRGSGAGDGLSVMPIGCSSGHWMVKFTLSSGTVYRGVFVL